jgi:hypothetical protein
MATLNNAIDFIFAEEASIEHGYYIVSSVGSTTFTSGDESRSLVTTKSPFKEIFDLHYVNDDSPLEFDFIVVKSDEINRYIDANDERILKKWLLKKKREWLQFDQEDLADTNYYVIISKIEKVDIATYTAAYKCHCICDCSHAWSNLRKKNYTSSGTYNFSLNSVVDYDEYIIYPKLIISPTQNGTVKIKNNTTNEEIAINNCVTTEQILLDCLTDKIQSSNGRIIISDWNKQTLGIKEGLNSFSLTGNFNLSMQYRLPVRVGA